ncbi:MAG: CopG family transcriptional regulator [Cyanobacteria bacterium P01_F01_bin.143]
MKANELDKKFDDGQESILEHFDLSKAERVNLQQQRVNIDIPLWMIQYLDQEASRLGIARQAVIKIWLADRIKEQHL